MKERGQGLIREILLVGLYDYSAISSSYRLNIVCWCILCTGDCSREAAQ